jgi:N6-L-threonylcarbamoyladenine synthase
VRILGIESSCDETAAAVVEDGESVLSSVVASQMSTHGKYGGVVPELASREHLRAIVPVVREALSRSGSNLHELSAVAVTVGPGLVGSLLVGLTYAKSLSFATGVPLIGINHIEGHIHAVIMEARRDGRPMEYPAVKSARDLSTAYSARRATTPPARHSTRSPSCWASAIPEVP